MENLAEKKISKRIEEIPEPYRKGYEKGVKDGNKSAAIKAFCLECCMWQENEIAGCKSVTCPLYSVRPFVKKTRSYTAYFRHGLTRIYTVCIKYFRREK
jgi:hypothetical protein